MPAGRPKGTTKTEEEKKADRARRDQEKQAKRKQQSSLRAFLATGVDEPVAQNQHVPVVVEEQARKETTDYDNDGEEEEDDDDDEELSDGEIEAIFQDLEDDTTSPMGELIKAVYQRLAAELNKISTAAIDRWLLATVKSGDWWIRSHQAPSLCKKLGLSASEKEYYRDLFVWLPLEQFGALVCPNKGCSHQLATHGMRGQEEHLSRCVLNLYEPYHIISRRYICPSCQEEAKKINAENQKLGEISVELSRDEAVVDLTIAEHTSPPNYTWAGNSRAILESLPDGQNMHFPAFLTHRGGVDMSIIDLMRPLYCCGIRSKQFSDCLNELAHKSHSRKWLQREYRIKKEKRMDATKAYSMFPKFDNSIYGGRKTTANYFSHVFKRYEQTVAEHMSIEVKKRPCEILRWDVSYKEAKQLCRYRGGRVFRGLVTATNELGEVRLQFHVVTDGQDQMLEAIARFKRTIEAYGQAGPRYVFTDKPTEDHPFFSQQFDSVAKTEEEMVKELPSIVLREDQNNHDMPVCSIESADYQLLRTTTEISQAVNLLRTHLETLKPDERAIGFDEEHEYGSKIKFPPKGRDKVALLQLGYRTASGKLACLLLQLHSHRELPEGLLKLFQDESILYVGKRVKNDIENVGDDFNIRPITDKMTFVDLATMAKDRSVISDRRTGLRDLVRIILKQKMSKIPEVRCSKWTKIQLSAEQQEYAALDAVKSVEVYSALLEWPDYHSRLSPSSAPLGTIVDIIPPTGQVGSNSGIEAKIAAVGRIVDDPTWSPPNTIRETNRRGPFRIVEVERLRGAFLRVPFFKVDTKTRRGQPSATLGHFRPNKSGDKFRVKVPLTMLKLHNRMDIGNDEPSKECSQCSNSWRIFVDDEDMTPLLESKDQEVVVSEEEDGLAARKDLSVEDMAFLQYLQELANDRTIKDPKSKLTLPPNEIRDIFRSVLGDAWHYMDRAKVPVKHKFRKAYFVALAEAWFAWDPVALAKVKEALRKDGLTEKEIDQKMYFDVDFFIQCVPRVVLPPSQLYWRVRNAFLMFGYKEDDGKPLFNDRAWKKANNVLKEILAGYASDPPGLTMYLRKLTEKGKEKTNVYGLPVFFCLRGTGLTESHHKQFLQSVGIWQMGIELADAIRQEHRHRYNHRMAERRRAGFPRFGHYDTWLIDEIQSIVEINHNVLVYPTWTNSLDYVDTEESCGVIPLQRTELTAAVNALQVDVELTKEQAYLALHQNCKLPLTPMTHPDEAKAFRELLLEDPTLARESEMERAAFAYLKYVNGTTIMPKLPVYLRVQLQIVLQSQKINDAVKSIEPELKRLREINSQGFPATALAESETVAASTGDRASASTGDDQAAASTGYRASASTGDRASASTGTDQVETGTATDHVAACSNTDRAAARLTNWPQVGALPPMAPPPGVIVNRIPRLVGGMWIGTTASTPTVGVGRKRARGADKEPRRRRKCKACQREDCRGRTANYGAGKCQFK
jgi:hypothetical protein